MFMRWVVLLCTFAFVLAGCQSQVYNQTEGNVADVKLKLNEAIRKQNADVKPKPALVVKPGLYVDTTPISLAKQPPWLKSHVLIRGDQLPFSYYSRTVASGANSNVLTKFQTGLNPNVNISLNYSGTIKGALDLLASKTGYVYSVRKNTIYWQAFVTRTFDIAFMPGGTDYLMGKASGGTSTAGAGSTNSSSIGSVTNYVSSDSSDSEFSSLKGSLSVWRDLNETLKQILSPEGTVMVSESTSSVTVRDRPTNIELVSQYVANLNNRLSKQVLIKVQIIAVDLSSDFNFGINWQLVANAFHNSPFVVNANYGTPVAITTVPNQLTLPLNQTAFPSTVPQFGTMVNPANQNQVPSWTILLNALSQQGKTSIVTEPRVICLNNQVSVIRITTSEGYVASIQNTSTGGGGTTTAAQNTVTSQVTPGMVITGLTLYVLPKIMKDNIFLQVNADISNNNGFQVFGPANAQVQLPSISAKSFNQRSLVKSGDTMILSGFRQVSNQTGAIQFMTSQALGGKASKEGSMETVILITPIVLHGSA